MKKDALQGLDFQDLLATQVNMDQLNSQLAGVWTTTDIDDGTNVGLAFTTAKGSDGLNVLPQLAGE